MCTNRKRITRYYPGIGKHVNQYFSCGKCVECLRQKQNQTSFLVAKQAEDSGSLIFVTLTYAPEHLPFAHVEQQFDMDSGCLIYQSDPLQVSEVGYSLGARYDKALTFSEAPTNRRTSLYRRYKKQLLAREELLRQDYLADKGRRLIEPFVFRTIEHEGVRHVGTITPTLRTSDVQLAVKRFRTKCSRSGLSLDKFKYFVCGEYGTKSGRPHYHLALHGITREVASILCQIWEENYGSTYIDVVPFNARTRVGDYIGKYLTKGEFDKVFVREGLCKKGRRQSSIGYGCDDIDRLRRYVLCFDVFGRYDVADPQSYPKNLKALLPMILERNSIFINNIRYAIPRIIKRKILYKESYRFGDVVASSGSDLPSCKHLKAYRPSALSRLLATRLQARYASDFDQKLRQSAFHYSSEDVCGPSIEVVNDEERSGKTRSARLIQDLRTFYEKSLF